MTTKQIGVRIPASTDKKLAEQAKVRGITKNGLINYLISEFLDKQKER